MTSFFKIHNLSYRNVKNKIWLGNVSIFRIICNFPHRNFFLYDCKKISIYLHYLQPTHLSFKNIFYLRKSCKIFPKIKFSSWDLLTFHFSTSISNIYMKYRLLFDHFNGFSFHLQHKSEILLSMKDKGWVNFP